MTLDSIAGYIFLKLADERQQYCDVALKLYCPNEAEEYQHQSLLVASNVLFPGYKLPMMH